MQMEFSHGDMFYPILEPLFIGGGDTIMVHGGPRTGLSRGRIDGTPGSTSAPPPPMATRPQQLAARVTTSSSVGPTCSSGASTTPVFRPGLSGPRVSCSRAQAAGSVADTPSTVDTPSAPPSNILCPSGCAFYSLPRPPTLAHRGPSYVPAGRPLTPMKCRSIASTAPPTASFSIFIDRHHAMRDTTIDLLNAVASTHTSILSVLPPNYTTSVSELRNEAICHIATTRIGPRQSVIEFRTSRAYARNSGQTRADTGFITSTNRRYIDMTVSNPAAPSYFPPDLLDPYGRLQRKLPGHSWVELRRTTDKHDRYLPVLGDLAKDPEHLAIFLVEATGRLSEASMKLLKFIVKDSASRSILNLFCTQIGGAIARYNAMAAAHAWVQYYLRSSHISVGEGA